MEEPGGGGQRSWNELRVCGPFPNSYQSEGRNAATGKKEDLEISSTPGHPGVYGVSIIPLSHKQQQFLEQFLLPPFGRGK